VDLLNVFGDFPTLKPPVTPTRTARCGDAQLGLWTITAIKEGLTTRPIDENVVSTWPPPGPTFSPRQPGHRPAAPYGLRWLDIN